MGNFLSMSSFPGIEGGDGHERGDQRVDKQWMKEERLIK